MWLARPARARVTVVCRVCGTRAHAFCRWKSDVNAFPQLDSQTEFGPTYEYEYSTRQAYGASIDGWGPNDPLNATWWHHVTEGTFDLSRRILVKRSYSF